MVGETLAGVRERIEALASPEGRFVVACARTGERPVPLAGLSFPDRATAAEAADLAGRYRATLRGYDPAVAHHDLVVHDGTPGPTARVGAGVGPVAGSDYAHDLVGALFESLSGTDNDAVERAVMDEYLALAETTTDTTDLCAVLLACLARELDAVLSPAEQSAVVGTAAERLGSRAASRPVRAAVDRLVAAGVAAGASVTRVRDDRWRVDLAGYALPIDERFPVLPLSVEVTRWLPLASVVADGATRSDDGRWRVAVARSDETDGRLACLPVDEQRA